MIERLLDALCIGDSNPWYEPVGAACERFEINTNPRMQMFLSQCAHESFGFTQLMESLKYSASRLREIFPAHFKTFAECVEFSNDEIRIAERVYGGRMGNGPEGSGEGWKYRGRGLLELTGLDEYHACRDATGLDCVAFPALLQQPDGAALSAAWYWQRAGCNARADVGDYVGVSGLVNRGRVDFPAEGMQDRWAWLKKAQEATA